MNVFANALNESMQLNINDMSTWQTLTPFYTGNDQVESKKKNTPAMYDQFFNRSLDMELQPH